MTQRLVLFFVCICACANLSAQSADETAVKGLIERRIELLNLAKSNQYIAQLMQLHHQDYSVQHVTYLPDGAVSNRHVDLAGFKRILSHYADNVDQQYTTSVRSIPFVRVFANTGVAIFVQDYTMKDANSGDDLYGGEEVVTANLKKTPDGWKFMSLYVTELRNQVNKYPCYYELYQKDANEMLATVKVPAGSSFQQEYLDVLFTEVHAGTVVVSARGDEFSWEDNVLRNTISNNDSEQIGRPNNKGAVIGDLIMHYHSDVCADARLAK